MREIKFRGKRVGNGQWIEGYYHYSKISESHFINGWEVEAETVGQFTGLHDKNGKKIFEGDVISTDLARDFLVVEFNGGAFVFNCNDGDKDYYDHINASHELKNEYEYGEVIGNIHEGDHTCS